MVDLSSVQNLVSSWWFDYDQGNFDIWPQYFTSQAQFECRSDKGDTEFEAFFRADLTGRDEVLAWHIDHRQNSPYPLRHNATNVHVTHTRGDEADFRSYLFVTQIAGGAVSNLSSGHCLGTVRLEDSKARFSTIRVILDYAESETFSSAKRFDLV
jgi:hypothetical protein